MASRSQMKKRLAPVVRRAMKETRVPGVAVGLIVDGDEFAYGFGVTSIEFPLDVDEHTMFQIGSTTKVYTGTVVMQLLDEGRLELEAPVVEYLPKFRLNDEALSAKVLVRHLVTHTGGWLGDYFDDLGRGEDALRRIVARMAKQAPQLTPLGEVWSYNNSGFYVLGRILETIEKNPYETIVKERILDPLGMDRSFFFPEDVITYKTAIGHNIGKDSVKIARPWGLARAANPAGGIVSTAVDQLKFARLHLGDGTSDDGTKVLTPEAVERMQQPLAPAGNLADWVGVTWLLEDIGPTRVVKHGGSINGHMSAFALVPDRNFAITVLTNGSTGHLLNNAVTTWAYKELLGAEAAKPKVKKLGRKAAGAYAGRYEMRFGHVVVTPVDGALEVSIELNEEAAKDEEVVAAMPAPIRLGMVGPDRGVVIEGQSAASRIEFVRGEDGDVGWIRYGGRVYRKVA